MNERAKQIYEFGAFRLDGTERVLSRDGKPVPLTPKAFEVLSLLVERHGHIVEKSALMEKVWADAFVEEGNLKATRCSVALWAKGQTNTVTSRRCRAAAIASSRP